MEEEQPTDPGHASGNNTAKENTEKAQPPQRIEENIAMCGDSQAANSVVIAKIAEGAEVNINNNLNNLEDRTKKKIESWTEGMVETQALVEVKAKLEKGTNWIIIRGGPGEGKRTVAYMALREVLKSRRLFEVITPEEMSLVISNCSQPVILLDGIFGYQDFDKEVWVNWKPYIYNLLGEKEHRVNEKYFSKQGNEAIIIMTARDHILNSVSSELKRISDFFTDDKNVVRIQTPKERSVAEKQKIWKAIVHRSEMPFDEAVAERICNLDVPHGYPDICRLFVKLAQKHANDTNDGKTFIDNFLGAPLQFLNQTVEILLSDKSKLKLFQLLISNASRLSLKRLEEESLRTVADNLCDTYLILDGEFITFAHPLVMESIARKLIDKYPLYVIKNCPYPFLNERVRFEGTDEQMDVPQWSRVSHIPRCYMSDLASRFAEAILERQLLQVLCHPSFADEEFVELVMEGILASKDMSDLIKFTDVKSNEEFLFLTSRCKSPQLLKYIDRSGCTLSYDNIKTVLYGVCSFAASKVLDYLFMSRRDLDINVRCDSGVIQRVPLMVAAGTRDADFVEKVLSLKPNVKLTDDVGLNALHYLCEGGLLSAVQKVVDIDPESIDCGSSCSDRTPLFFACWYNHIEVARYLLEKGAKVNSTIFVDTCGRGNIDVVKLLFEYKARVKMIKGPFPEWLSPLSAAARNGKIDVMEVLFKKGADVNFHLLAPPLVGAFYYEQHQAAVMLLEHCANPNVSDARGCSILHLAIRKKNKKFLKILLNGNADASLLDGDGLTSIFLANSDLSCLNIFINHGADVNARNEDDSTPLHKASASGYKECVLALIDAKADVNLQDRRGLTALHRAAENGLTDIVDILIKAGANVNSQDHFGRTPLELAIKWGDPECVQVLKVNGGSCWWKNERLELSWEKKRTNSIEQKMNLTLLKGSEDFESGDTVQSTSSPLGSSSGKDMRKVPDVFEETQAPTKSRNPISRFVRSLFTRKQ